jgi:hypothetical protein
MLPIRINASDQVHQMIEGKVEKDFAEFDL